MRKNCWSKTILVLLMLITLGGGVLAAASLVAAATPSVDVVSETKTRSKVTVASPSPDENLETIINQNLEEATLSAEASLSATASDSTKLAIQEKKDQDLTETVSQASDDLATFIQNQTPIELKWYNFLQYYIRSAIQNGLPANIVVLVLMFPLVASLIAFARHVIGLRGFGIYAPAVLSVAFVSTGIPLGIMMFIFVILVAAMIRKLNNKLNLPYLPKTALLLWGISIAVLALLIVAGNFDLTFLMKISIFPLLIIILLSENFMETQLFSNQGEAFRLTLETIIIAILGALLISSQAIQRIVILNPEITLIAIGLIDVLIGSFTGLRLMELWRFRNVAKSKKK